MEPILSQSFESASVVTIRLERKRQRTESAEAEVPPRQPTPTTAGRRGLRQLAIAVWEPLKDTFKNLTRKKVKPGAKDASEVVNSLPLPLVDSLVYFLLTHRMSTQVAMTVPEQRLNPEKVHVRVDFIGYVSNRTPKKDRKGLPGAYAQWPIPESIVDFAETFATHYPDSGDLSEWMRILEAVAGTQPQLHSLFYRFLTRGGIIHPGYDVSHLLKMTGRALLSLLILDDKRTNEERKTCQDLTWDRLVTRSGRYSCSHDPKCWPTDYQTMISEMREASELNETLLPQHPDLKFVYPLPVVFSEGVFYGNYWDSRRISDPLRRADVPGLVVIDPPLVRLSFHGSGKVAKKKK